jgi:transcriptional regulator GlxA family with amidase domain
LTTQHRRVGIVLCDNVLATSATLPIEMLQTAKASAGARGVSEVNLEILTLSPGGKTVTSASGFDLVPSAAIEDSPQLDLVHFPGQWRNPRRTIRKHPEIAPWLWQQHRYGAAITGVGTGVCFVAAAGLLNDKPATTHWHYFDQFQKDYPEVLLKRQYFITQAGNIYCAASVNTLAELMVHIIYLWYGRGVANNVERNFFHEIRGTFEPSRYFAEHVEHHSDENILQVQIWLDDNFIRKVSFPILASQFGMSTRTFNRRFKQALGKTPGGYLQQLRLGHARDMLQKTNLSIMEVAGQSGYQDASHFTRQFQKFFHITPGEYRETVRAKLFSMN